jgi:hypothetical protein
MGQALSKSPGAEQEKKQLASFFASLFFLFSFFSSTAGLHGNQVT